MADPTTQPVGALPEPTYIVEDYGYTERDMRAHALGYHIEQMRLQGFADGAVSLWAYNSRGEALHESRAETAAMMAERDAAREASDALRLELETAFGYLREALEFQSAPQGPSIHDFGRWRRFVDLSQFRTRPIPPDAREGRPAELANAPSDAELDALAQLWFGTGHAPTTYRCFRLMMREAIRRAAREGREPQWISVADRLPNDFEVVLTMHAEDLYPVAAYCMPSGEGHIWRREVEGPEDCQYPGKHDILYRWPTHWQLLPAPPAGTSADGETQP